MYRFARWQPLIQSANTEADLVKVMREYLSTWLPSDWERLPAECRVTHVDNALDIAVAAVTLAQHEVRGGLDDEATELLRHMADVFVAAQMRLRQILGRKHDPSLMESD